MFSSDAITFRTTPALSTTNVTRLANGRRPHKRCTPKPAATTCFWSATSGKFSFSDSANALCFSTPSRLTPKISAPAAETSAFRSRKVHASFVQPGVKSFG
jgi:hypothetical protein